MKLIVDRTEGQMVICVAEDGTRMELALEVFEEHPEDGDCIWLEEGRAVIDRQATEERRAEMEKKFRRLLKK